MVKPKGGRGLTAPYETTHVRVPVPIKDQVDKLVNDYREQLLGSQNGCIQLDNQPHKLPNLPEAIALAKQILKGKKSASVSVSKLLTALYGVDVEL